MPKVNTYSRIEDLPASYVQLFEQSADHSFFYSLPWFRNYVRTALDPDDRVRIYGVALDDANETPVAALTTRYRSPSAGVFRPRELLGLSNYYTSLFGPILDESRQDAPAILQELAKAIAGDASRWDFVNFKPLDVNSPLFGHLVNSLRSAGLVVQTYFCAGNWYAPVDGRTYKQYFEGLRSSVRNIAKSKIKKLERSGRARFKMISDQAGLEAALEAYARVYAASWKVPEPYPNFIPGLIRTCAEMGWLRLGVVYFDEEPAAVQLWIVHGGVASIYKMAYDPCVASFSVGTYLTTKLMQYVIDMDRVREVDYLTGDDAYKKDWMSHRRERWGILALNPRTVNGTLGIIRHVGGRIAKTAMRGLIQRSKKVLPNPLPAWQRFSKRSSTKGRGGRGERKTSGPSENFSGIERPSDRG